MTTMDQKPTDNVTPVPLHLLRDNGCKWPYGDRNYTFCNRSKRPGVKEVYCTEHARLAYTPVTFRGNRR